VTEVIHEPLALNTSEVIEIDGESVLVCNSGGSHFAIRNQCTHQNTPLAGGRIRNGFISCPLHGVRFDLVSGEPRGSLTRVSVKTYEVREQDGMIVIST
jgi:3-phenylpropionate/trans-cinnamate dioxygenase ferredoxin subunit